MQFLDYEVNTRPGDLIHVALRGNEANVRVMDDLNFMNYRSGRQFQYFGGHYRQSPVNIPAPGLGRWHVVIDLGGYGGSVEAAVRVISN
ncbi:MAG TPA: DUF1883 domain-containing protein [Candidatus Limnocylindrales bacterium]|nr:DUF1883 domain-containing protein [Candidatus Limnocylindrales bacterium]